MNAEAMPIEVEYSVPHRFPFHIGLFLAVNAIPDAYGLIDGPDCIFRKTEWVHGKHDWRSTLLDGLGNHRIVNTLMNAEQVIKNKGDELTTRIRRVSALPGSALIVVCSMPHVMIIGLQYDKILRGLQPEVSPQLIELPSRSLDGDWLDGYAETLAVIAYKQPISRGSIASIRAVNVDSVVRTLLGRGLITEAFTDNETGAIAFRATLVALS